MHNRNISNRFVSDYEVELQRGEGKVPDKTEDHRIKHIQQWTVEKGTAPISRGCSYLIVFLLLNLQTVVLV